jgi:hypothetical protein
MKASLNIKVLDDIVAAWPATWRQCVKQLSYIPHC